MMPDIETVMPSTDVRCVVLGLTLLLQLILQIKQILCLVFVTGFVETPFIQVKLSFFGISWVCHAYHVHNISNMIQLKPDKSSQRIDVKTTQAVRCHFGHLRAFLLQVSTVGCENFHGAASSDCRAEKWSIVAPHFICYSFITDFVYNMVFVYVGVTLVFFLLKNLFCLSIIFVTGLVLQVFTDAAFGWRYSRDFGWATEKRLTDTPWYWK